jgi:hypothetical protein
LTDLGLTGPNAKNAIGGPTIRNHLRSEHPREERSRKAYDKQYARVRSTKRSPTVPSCTPTLHGSGPLPAWPGSSQQPSSSQKAFPIREAAKNGPKSPGSAFSHGGKPPRPAFNQNPAVIPAALLSAAPRPAWRDRPACGSGANRRGWKCATWDRADANGASLAVLDRLGPQVHGLPR